MERWITIYKGEEDRRITGVEKYLERMGQVEGDISEMIETIERKEPEQATNQAKEGRTKESNKVMVAINGFNFTFRKEAASMVRAAESRKGSKEQYQQEEEGGQVSIEREGAEANKSFIEMKSKYAVEMEVKSDAGEGIEEEQTETKIREVDSHSELSYFVKLFDPSNLLLSLCCDHLRCCGL